MKKLLDVLMVLSFLAGVAVDTVVRVAVQAAHAQSYSDGKDCMLTSNPPVAGHMVDGVCLPTGVNRVIGTGWANVQTIEIMRKCPSGYTAVLTAPSGRAMCAPGLIEPE